MPLHPPPPPRDNTLWRTNNYPARARLIRAAAYANPDTRCWRCGERLDHPRHRHRNGKPSHWTAGHIIDGDPTSPLAAEASACNYTEGARLGGRRRQRTRRRQRRSPNA